MQLVHLFAINLRGMESLQEPLAMEWTSSELMEMIFFNFFLKFLLCFFKSPPKSKIPFFQSLPFDLRGSSILKIIKKK